MGPLLRSVLPKDLDWLREAFPYGNVLLQVISRADFEKGLPHIFVPLQRTVVVHGDARVLAVGWPDSVVSVRARASQSVRIGRPPETRECYTRL